MKCKTCGAKDLLRSDICGDHCIYCAGTGKTKKLEFAVTGKLICEKCGKEVTSMCNDMCWDCYHEEVAEQNKRIELQKLNWR